MSKWTRAEILIVRQCAGTMKVANIGRQEGISMKTDTDGLTMNQLAERNAALTAKLSMINDLMEVAEQANKLAQEAAEKLFLAEVRAQGVEMFGSTTIQFGEEEGDEDIIYAGNQALLFAAQLRREAAQ
ncbi:hypothetical protein KG383_002740 [Salmonella enterica subsp. enterica serovar Newport]|nr:hypothetical protein [Salmonella enterica subsp. enterica serovar Newport]